jgi:hypothetical protein
MIDFTSIPMPQAQTILSMVLVLVSLLIWRSLAKRDRSTASRLNFDDLLLGEDGRMSKAAVVMLGAFAMTTWLMIYLALTDHMSEGYLVIYVGAWITPTVAKLFATSPKTETVIEKETAAGATEKTTITDVAATRGPSE